VNFIMSSFDSHREMDTLSARETPPPAEVTGAMPQRGARRSSRAHAATRRAAEGAELLSDAELLARLGGADARAVEGSPTRLSRRLARHGSAELARWSADRWARVPGVGPARAEAMMAAFELGRRSLERAPASAPIRGPEDVRPHVRDLCLARKEHFVVLLLNARHEIQARETVSIGSLNASIVHPREVFLPAILHSAASVVLVHNHPSGDPGPSEEDLSITRRLVQVGDLVGIGVLDHVIVAERGVVSLRARQLM
jgi:DNA repair protein RadC